MRREIFQQVGTMLLVFVLGGAAGGLFVGWRTIHVMRAEIEAGPPSQLPARLTLLLYAEAFNLRADQRDRIRPILISTFEELGRLRSRLEKEEAPIRWRERAAVRAILDAKQRAEYDRGVRANDESRGWTPEPQSPAP